MKSVMSVVTIAGLLCTLLSLATAAPAMAFNDGLSFDNNVTVTPNGNRSTARRRHSDYNSSTGTNADDYNFIGVQGSLGIAGSSLSGANVDTSTQLGMMWGAYYERRFIPYFGLRLEGEYNQRGFSQKDGEGGTDNFNANFMEFALLAKTQIPTRIVTPFIAVGPFMGFAVSRSETDTPAQGQSQSGSLNNFYNSFNFGLDFGGGIDFQVVRHLNIEVGARYSLGLLNMITAQAAQNVSLHLNDIQILSGVSYSL